MAYYDTINLVAGDDKPELDLRLRDKNKAAEGLNLDPDDPDTWAPIDITNASVRVKFKQLGQDEVLDTLSCSKVAPFDEGHAVMYWNPTTLDVDPGTYEGEIEIVYLNGQILTLFDKLKFKVRKQF